MATFNTKEELREFFISEYVEGKRFGWDPEAERCRYYAQTKGGEPRRCAVGQILSGAIDDTHPVWNCAMGVAGLLSAGDDVSDYLHDVEERLDVSLERLQAWHDRWAGIHSRRSLVIGQQPSMVAALDKALKS